MGEFESLQGRHRTDFGFMAAGRPLAACFSFARQRLDYNCSVNTRTFLLLLLAAVLSGCALQTGITGPGGATPYIITATLPPTPIPSITPTPVPPTPTATTVPVAGMTTTQVNVRATPSTAGTQLAILPPFAKVQIVGKDAGSAWYLILYPDAPGGTGWVTAQYVNVIQGADQIPVVIGAPTQGSAPNQTPGSSASGVISQQVNVRKGPGTEFDALGTLNPKDVVALTGKDPSGSWLQIQYTGAPGGVGWVAASFVQAAGAESLPIVGSAGEVVGTGTPPPTAAVLTPTPGAALQDNDSAEAPAASASLSSSGTRSLIYTSDLSAPQGDGQDWVGFTTASADVLVSLSCTGNAGVDVQLTQNGAAVAGADGLACGASRLLHLQTGSPYLLRLSMPAGAPAPSYVQYSLRVEISG
jgi:uncharacterized protein YraI